MNSELLRTFLEVAKTRHFGHAADNLYLTQSAVSSRIKQLETVVGQPVFTRQRNNLLLTVAGERLISHAENILASWQLAVQEVGVPTQKNAQLAIGGTSNLWDTFLQSLVPRIAENFPHLYIRTEINNPQHLVRFLLGGRVDVFATFDPPLNAQIDTRPIGKITLVMVCNTPKISIDEISNVGHVFVDWGTSFNLQQARMFKEPIAPILHTAQSQIALEFILTCRGAAFLPSALVEPYLNDGMLHLVSDAEKIEKNVYAVYSKGADKSQNVGPVLNMLEESEIAPETAIAPLPMEDINHQW